MIASDLERKERESRLLQYVKKPTKSPINSLRSIFLARYQPVKPEKVEKEMLQCGFTPQQQSFVWQWVRQEIDLVRKNFKQMRLEVDEADLDELYK